MTGRIKIWISRIISLEEVYFDFETTTSKKLVAFISSDVKNNNWLKQTFFDLRSHALKSRLLKSFHYSNTKNGYGRGILSSHRFFLDIFAWIQQSLAEERELFESILLFVPEKDLLLTTDLLLCSFWPELQDLLDSVIIQSNDATGITRIIFALGYYSEYFSKLTGTNNSFAKNLYL